MTQTITLDQLPPGLNGKDGLRRMHWSAYRKLRESFYWLIRAEDPKKHSGRVSITYTRKSIIPMDWDNHGASFKLIGDALEGLGVIKDDGPDTVVNLKLKYSRAKSKKEQAVIIQISDL